MGWILATSGGRLDATQTNLVAQGCSILVKSLGTFCLLCPAPTNPSWLGLGTLLPLR